VTFHAGFGAMGPVFACGETGMTPAFLRFKSDQVRDSAPSGRRTKVIGTLRAPTSRRLAIALTGAPPTPADRGRQDDDIEVRVSVRDWRSGSADVSASWSRKAGGRRLGWTNRGGVKAIA